MRRVTHNSEAVKKYERVGQGRHSDLIRPKKLDDLCKTGMTDFSHLQRSGANRALEKYQTRVSAA